MHSMCVYLCIHSTHIPYVKQLILDAINLTVHIHIYIYIYIHTFIYRLYMSCFCCQGDEGTTKIIINAFNSNTCEEECQTHRVTFPLTVLVSDR